MPLSPHSNRLVDLTHPLVHGAGSFPDDPALSMQPHARISTHQFNTTHLQTGTHQGTHLDAMFHFFRDGKTVEQLPLEWLHGPARVLRVPKGAGEEITMSDLQQYSAHLQQGARILINTGWHHRFGREEFYTAYPSLTIEAAQYLARSGIRMLGIDMPTLGRRWLELHHALLHPAVEVVVVESLANLDALPDTEFTLSALPLPLQGCDGSPVRAVAIL